MFQTYQGYKLPLIDYRAVVWGTTSSSNLDRMSKLVKRAARIILHANFNTLSAATKSKTIKIQQGRLHIQSHEQFYTPVYQ